MWLLRRRVHHSGAGPPWLRHTSQQRDLRQEDDGEQAGDRGACAWGPQAEASGARARARIHLSVSGRSEPEQRGARGTIEVPWPPHSRLKGSANDAKRRELAAIKRQLDGLVDAIADGLRAPGLQQRLDELEARRVEIEQSLAAPPSPVRLHPNLAELYRRQVAQLQRSLSHPEIRDEAVQILRGLIERVSIRPTADGMEIEIVGEIAKMVDLGLEVQQKTGHPR